MRGGTVMKCNVSEYKNKVQYEMRNSDEVQCEGIQQ